MSVAYNPSIVTNNLALCLDVANVKSYAGSGTTWNDLSSNQLVSTLVGSPTIASGALSLNGTNQCATIPYTTTLAPTTELTVVTWARATNWQTAANRRIVSKTEGGGYQIATDNTSSPGNLLWAVHVGGSYRDCTFPMSQITSGWHNITGTCNGRISKIFIDGVEVNSIDIGSTLALTYTNNNIFVVGAEPQVTTVVGNYFPGDIGPVMVYNRALTAAEVAQNFNAYRGRFGI